MMKLFRNSFGSLDDPPSLSDAQILDVIDRGTLEDWDYLVRPLVADPDGDFARKVETMAWQSELTGAGNAFINLLRLLRGDVSSWPLLRRTESFDDGY